MASLLLVGMPFAPSSPSSGMASNLVAMASKASNLIAMTITSEGDVFK